MWNMTTTLPVNNKLIMDPVHGGIPLNDLEIAVIDHPLFQRLRNICQNDILSLVFPGATHSRFLHSIGCMHVGGRMLKSISEPFLKSEVDQLINDRHMSAYAYFYRVVRLACLLHDVGHSSFSHQFTHSKTISQLMSVPEGLKTLWEGTDVKATKSPDSLEHEHYSIRSAFQILNDIKSCDLGVIAEDVLSIMEDSFFRPSETFNNHANILWEVLKPENINQEISSEQVCELTRQLLSSIISGEIDADRADYMLRDGFHSSVSIGSYNLDHLLKNLRVGVNIEEPWMGLSITRKGLGVLEDFVYSRHQMYCRVYGHKTSIGFDLVLRKAIDEVLDQPEIFEYVRDSLMDLSEFRHLTDNYFWEEFRRYSRRNPESYARCLIDRIKLKHIESEENLTEEEINQKLDDIADKLQISPDRIVHGTIKAKFSKIESSYDKIRVVETDPYTKQKSLVKISEASTFFEKFQDHRITHFYVKPFSADKNKD